MERHWKHAFDFALILSFSEKLRPLAKIVIENFHAGQYTLHTVCNEASLELVRLKLETRHMRDNDK